MTVANPFDLSGRVAVVTGSSRGIGRSTALLLARLGARVVVSSRTAEACRPVADAITSEGGEAAIIPCHIGRRPEVERLVAGTIERFGRIDILVCNAAVNPAYGPMAALTDEAFGKIMGSNVLSTLWLCNLVLPGMAERGGGSVVIVSSIAGLRGTEGIGGYGLSKAAELALARNLAAEWGRHGVRVNCVAPGLVRTDFARALMEDEAALARRDAATPLRRVGEPDEIAGAIAFLASDAASFVTGHALVADGGVTIV